MHAEDSNTCRALAAGLALRGWACRDRFPPDPLAGALLREAEDIWRDGAFRKAGIGRGENFLIRPDIRGDYVHWPEPDDLPAVRRLHEECLEPLRRALNEATLLGLFDFEGHYAVYPPGAAYARHVDRFHDAAQRVVSVVLYLNPGWRAEDGGALRLYVPDEAGIEQAVDILPEAGRLVCFLSDRISHEVLETRRERFSFTGWFRVRA